MGLMGLAEIGSGTWRHYGGSFMTLALLRYGAHYQTGHLSIMW